MRRLAVPFWWHDIYVLPDCTGRRAKFACFPLTSSGGIAGSLLVPDGDDNRHTPMIVSNTDHLRGYSDGTNEAMLLALLLAGRSRRTRVLKCNATRKSQTQQIDQPTTHLERSTSQATLRSEPANYDTLRRRHRSMSFIFGFSLIHDCFDCTTPSTKPPSTCVTSRHLCACRVL